MLYKLCYYRTPYDDGSKMAICNADLKLPANPGPHVIFHDLLSMSFPSSVPLLFVCLQHGRISKGGIHPCAHAHNPCPERTLEKNPKDRATAEEVLEELQKIKKQLGPRPSGPDVLDVPPIEVNDMNGAAAGGSGSMSSKGMEGGWRTVR